ncbi:hypothetical protein GHT06_022891 [Daphnia sinensis]|uniref:HTH CENPB-type domain-containing protein n=1 Tax=Daphnia sinensis TaxID=1820382 RepID=A0AAD5PRG8_9CRUS|nr:hypothetical protein GHT06_022891 [Daphnia sinensis]
MAYTTENLENAVATYVIRNGSYRSIASMFGVPKSTLREKVAGEPHEEGPIKNKRRRPTVLLEEDENVIANWVRSMANAGFPVTDKELLDFVQHTLNKAKRVTSLDNSRPAETWLLKFRQRHNLSIRTAEILDPEKSQITHQDLLQWANNVKEYFKLVTIVVQFCCSWLPLHSL